MIVRGYSNIATIVLLRKRNLGTSKPMLAESQPLETGRLSIRDGLPDPALEETCSGCARNVL